MSDVLDKTIAVTTVVDSSGVVETNYGTILFVKEFDAFATAVPFQGTADRHRAYYSLDEILEDGWDIDSDVYAAFTAFFSQEPNGGYMVLGRKDATDASWVEAISAINDKFIGWWALAICLDGDETQTEYKTLLKQVGDYVETKKKVFIHATSDEGVFSYARVASKGYLVTGRVADVELWQEVDDGSLTVSIDGVTAFEITAMDFSSVSTLAEVATIIDGKIAGGTVTAIGLKLKFESDTTGKESSIVLSDGVTGTSISSLLNLGYAITEAGYDLGSTPNGSAGVTGNADLNTFLGAYGYDRTLLSYGAAEQDSQHYVASACEWHAIRTLSEGLVYDPASQTWAYKLITGATTIETTNKMLNFLMDLSIPRICNIYTIANNVGMNWKGRMVSYKPLDLIRGIDWFDDLIQTNIFTEITKVTDGNRKIPADETGLGMIENILKATFEKGSVNFLRAETVEYTMPTIEDLDARSEADKRDRKLPAIPWKGTTKGAFEEFEINGIISL